jgi:hypothetical protein
MMDFGPRGTLAPNYGMAPCARYDPAYWAILQLVLVSVFAVQNVH